MCRPRRHVSRTCSRWRAWTPSARRQRLRSLSGYTRYTFLIKPPGRRRLSHPAPSTSGSKAWAHAATNVARGRRDRPIRQPLVSGWRSPSVPRIPPMYVAAHQGPGARAFRTPPEEAHPVGQDRSLR